MTERTLPNDLTARERHLIEHSLGLDRATAPYRNYFAAGDGHADRPDLDALVGRKLMQFKPREPGGTVDIYRVTAAGAEAVGVALPRPIVET